MDPNETLKRIDWLAYITKDLVYPTSEFMDERQELGELLDNLYSWILRGGFEPDWPMHPFGTTAYRRYLTWLDQQTPE